jgi:hypothetical protein
VLTVPPSGEDVAIALPPLEVAPGTKVVLRLVTVSPEVTVPEVLVEVLLLPAPVLTTNEVELLEALLDSRKDLGISGGK